MSFVGWALFIAPIVAKWLRAEMVTVASDRYPVAIAVPAVKDPAIGRPSDRDLKESIPGATLSAPADLDTSRPPETPSSAPAGLDTAVPPEAPLLATADLDTAVPPETPSSAPAGLDTAAQPEAPLSAPADLDTAVPPETPYSAPADLDTSMPPETPSSAPADLDTAVPSETPSSAQADCDTVVPPEAPLLATADLDTAVPSETPSSAPADCGNILTVKAEEAFGDVPSTVAALATEDDCLMDSEYNKCEVVSSALPHRECVDLEDATFLDAIADSSPPPEIPTTPESRHLEHLNSSRGIAGADSVRLERGPKTFTEDEAEVPRSVTIEALRSLSDTEVAWSTPLESSSPVLASTPVNTGSPLRPRRVEETAATPADLSIADEGEGTWRDNSTPIVDANAGSSVTKSKHARKR